MSLQGEPWSQTGRIPHATTKVVFSNDWPQPLLLLLLLPLLLLGFFFFLQIFQLGKFSLPEEAEELVKK